MTADDLAAALRACAAGLYPLEAGTALLIGNGTFLHHPDFTSRFIATGTSISDGTTPMADIDWDAAITALRAGELSCSGGERRVSSCHPASPAASPSTCATPSPASTTPTSPGSSPPSSTHPGNDPRTADTDRPDPRTQPPLPPQSRSTAGFPAIRLPDPRNPRASGCSTMRT
jgi:hypothetical protein